jgi:hypothetical protein
MHKRLAPKEHYFDYSIFMLWLDVDELDYLNSSIRWFSRNRFNLFSFYDKDHFKRPKGTEDYSNIRKRCIEYLKTVNQPEPYTIRLLTNVRVLGYVFNPVSFYYLYDKQEICNGIMAEVANTYGEMKLFFIEPDGKEVIKKTDDKLFYVSPFTDLDDVFHFSFKLPGELYFTGINVSKQDTVYFYSNLSGKRSPLTSTTLLKRFFAVPLVTLRIIFGIHWQAFRIWVKGIPYNPKKGNQHLQHNIINK